MENTIVLREFIKFIHKVLMGSNFDLDKIREFLSQNNFTEEHFNALCIYHYTQNICITDGYICVCAFQKMCRVANAMQMKPNVEVVAYISQRINACGSTSEMEQVEKWLGITCQSETVS